MKVDGGFGAARTARSVEPKRRVVAMSPRRFGLARLAREFLLEVQHAFRAARSARDVSGYGALRKLKIRFAAAGEKTFIADKAKLKVVTKR